MSSFRSSCLLLCSATRVISDVNCEPALGRWENTKSAWRANCEVAYCALTYGPVLGAGPGTGAGVGPGDGAGAGPGEGAGPGPGEGPGEGFGTGPGAGLGAGAGPCCMGASAAGASPPPPHAASQATPKQKARRSRASMHCHPVQKWSSGLEPLCQPPGYDLCGFVLSA